MGAEYQQQPEDVVSMMFDGYKVKYYGLSENFTLVPRFVLTMLDYEFLNFLYEAGGSSPDVPVNDQRHILAEKLLSMGLVTADRSLGINPVLYRLTDLGRDTFYDMREKVLKFQSLLP